MSSRRARHPRLPLPSGTAIPWVIAIAAVIGCIGLAAWTTALRDDIDAAEERVAALTTERNQLREAATASVFDLTPTAEGPANGGGTLYLTATGSGVLTVVNMPDLAEGETYQAWFLPPDEGEPIPGGTFTVDDRGIGFMLVAADTGAFRGVAISLEPEAGSETPSGPMLLTGAAGGARG
jgi:hypothetical protein